ncbi:LacI family DNA-binding transcriptional regulator [Alkalihalophilus marmarensis]|jgi:DNA-binding LacI/PurR family transcriptional regulator|nr:LacI family DNA-binding transcriptional regulator [Alkalihalophilus marmarensis]MCM3491058.1 LacI family DNA-binding transcriptional regulator [Alkalihalophilus marmarensis]
MATIREIAKIAQVSVATVSRVLNDHPYVSKEKKRLCTVLLKNLITLEI